MGQAAETQIEHPLRRTLVRRNARHQAKRQQAMSDPHLLQNFPNAQECDATGDAIRNDCRAPKITC